MSAVFIIFLMLLSGLLAGVIFQFLNENQSTPAAVYHPAVRPAAVNTTRRYAGRFNVKNIKA